MKKQLFLSLQFVLLFTVTVFAQYPKGTKEVIILHTNDMHAKIDNLSKVAYLADSLRSLHPYVFLVAAGDNFTGNPVVDMVADKGYPMIELMNMCGYNLSCFGNHEFDLGQETLNKRRAQATFPFISCNIDAGTSVLVQPEPYYILKAGKTKIPVLGIIQLGENGLPDSHPSRLGGIKFTDGITKAKEYTWLKKKYGMMIALTHLGIEGDVPLAQQIPELDLIIGGHSHTTMDKPLVENGVSIVQTGSGVKNVGKTTLFIHKKKIIDIKYELIPMASLKNAKPELVALINKYNDNDELNRVVGFANTAFNNEVELGSMMTDAITSVIKTDFAFQNAGGVRIPTLPAGDIKLKDIYRIDPFGNQVVLFTMNTSEIKTLIRNAYNREKSIDLYPSGMNYTVFTDASGVCTDVAIYDYSGKPIDDSKEYKVGINSYIAASYKFDHRDAGSTHVNTTAQTLLEYLGSVKSVDYQGSNRTTIIKK